MRVHCNGCDRDLARSDFYADRASKTGKRSRCKRCTGGAVIRWRQTHVGKASRSREARAYRHTTRGAKAAAAYRTSQKGKEAQSRYASSKKGKETKKRANARTNGGVVQRAAMKRWRDRMKTKRTVSRFFKEASFGCLAHPGIETTVSDGDMAAIKAEISRRAEKVRREG